MYEKPRGQKLRNKGQWHVYKRASHTARQKPMQIVNNILLINRISVYICIDIDWKWSPMRLNLWAAIFGPKKSVFANIFSNARFSICHYWLSRAPALSLPLSVCASCLFNVIYLLGVPIKLDMRNTNTCRIYLYSSRHVHVHLIVSTMSWFNSIERTLFTTFSLSQIKRINKRSTTAAVTAAASAAAVVCWCFSSHFIA